ncbi:MAG: HlyC/CorC family transporter [Phycisphaerae bacterium]|nr:HlyC/CorC family transporter [Phycisphaerae bacterium]
MVINWSPWVGLISLGALMLFTALNLALRSPARARLGEQFEKRGRETAFEVFALRRSQYILATAILRAATVIALFVAILDYVGVFDAEAQLWQTLAASGAAWLLVLIVGVAIPSAWAKYAGDQLIIATLPLLEAARLGCYPLIIVLELFDPFVRRLAGVPVRDAAYFAQEFEQEILNAVSEGERHGAVDEEEAEMIESVIELGDRTVEEIMTPRTDIVALPRDADLATVLDTIRQKGHSRVPVFDETIDHVLGVLYAKDLLRRDESRPFQLTTVMREALFIPESKPVRELLREFQQKRVHIAVVLDEYGGTAGLVTIEDILEELVGDITDEYDTSKPAELVQVDEHTAEVDARMRVDELNDELDIELPDEEDFETIGGFVFSKLGRIPSVGEKVEHDNVTVRVIAADARRILRVRLEISPAEQANQVAG